MKAHIVSGRTISTPCRPLRSGPPFAERENSMRSTPHTTSTRFPLASGGFTLIELIIGLSIVTILAGLALTVLQQYAGTRSSGNAAYEFSASLSKARAMAIERASDVYVLIYETGSTSGATGGGG